MKKVNKLLAIVLAFAVLLTGFAKEVEAVEGESSKVVERLQGPDRVETSIKVSNEVYPDGSTDNVVLAGWSGEVDALTATLLASVKDAPLLLVTDSRYATIKEELDRLGVKKVYLAGGASVVSNKLEQQLKKDQYSVQRVSGDNRYHTAAKIMEAAGVNSKHVFLVNGGAENKNQLVDALAIGPVSGQNKTPILLTSKDKVPQATLDALKGVGQITIVGGNAAVSAQVAKTLGNQGYKVARVEGKDRYQTAVEISKEYFDKSTKSILVNDGRVSLADALVGGYLGAKKDAPILLTNADQLTGQTKTHVENKMTSSYILGGTKSINSNLFNQLDKILNPFRVVLDYGHGGKDSGANYNGRLEKDDVLRLGRLITAELRRQGIVVDETRKGDEYVSLTQRSGFANRHGRDYYNYFVSIHRNDFHLETANGAETFVYVTRNPLSVELATNIQRGLVDIGFRNRTVKEGIFHVLEATYAPAVLVEVGFMRNEKDNQIFDEHLEEIAQSIADAVMIQAK